MTCGYGPSCCKTDCCCATPADNYVVELTGITNGTETGCTVLNTKYCLCFYQCNWYATKRRIVDGVGPFAADCPGDVSGFILNLVFECDNNRVRLYVYAHCVNEGNILGLLATYEKSRASWNCSGSNTLTKVSSSGDCITWPATVTATPNSTETVCKCDCGDPEPPPYAFEFVCGPITDSSCFDPCGCAVLEMRVCLQGTECFASGVWEHDHYFEHGTIDFYLPVGQRHQPPGACTPAFYGVNTPILSQFDAVSNKIIVSMGSLSSKGIVRYAINASSFNPTGDNTLTFLDSDSLSCSMPATAQLNFVATNADGTACAEYPVCSFCTTWPQGWTFTIAGVTGPEDSISGGDCKVRPCQTINGSYCLSNIGAGDCTYVSDERLGPGAVNPFGPSELNYTAAGLPCYAIALPGIPIQYWNARAFAVMGINGGVVYVQIIVYYKRVGDSNYSAEVCDMLIQYEIALSAFNCNGSNVLSLRCSRELAFSDTLPSPCVCTSIPSTITISPTTTCGTPPPPPTGCECLPKSSYSPVLMFEGIDDGSCEECVCFDQMQLCLQPDGDADVCTWRADFTFPAGHPFCTSGATYVTLDVASTDPDFVTVKIFDASNSELARFQSSISGFDCDTADTEQLFVSQSDDCDWSGVTCTLNMHGSACPECYPCDSETTYAVEFNYDGQDYYFCVLMETCSATSGYALVPGGGTDKIYVKVEFGAYPFRFARVWVYLHPTSGPDTLIGVYNYLSDIGGFGCSEPASNVLHLSWNNVGQCGWEVDETETASLSSTLALFENTACNNCSGASISPTLTATFKNFTSNCCDNGLSTTLIYDSGTNSWTGTITGCSSGESINITLRQTGTDCTTFEVDVEYVNSCDPGVLNRSPFSCTCALLKFKVTGSVDIFEDELWVSLTV